MKQLSFSILKKRWYIFIILFIMTSLMNIVLWNEASQLLRKLPELQTMEKRIHLVPDYHELRYIPNAKTDGQVIKNTENEQEGAYQLFLHHFYTQPDKAVLLTNKTDYLLGRGELQAISQEELSRLLKGSDDFAFADNQGLAELVVTNEVHLDLEQLTKDLASYNFSIDFVSLQTSYRETYDFYLGNLIFGCVVFVFFSAFGLILIYWLISSSLKISQQDIRLLRIIGLSKKQLIRHYSHLFASVTFTSLVLAFLFIYSTGLGLRWFDYLYMVTLNLALVSLVGLMVKNRVGRYLHD